MASRADSTEHEIDYQVTLTNTQAMTSALPSARPFAAGNAGAAAPQPQQFQVPQFMRQNTWQPLKQQQAALPGMFDTSGLAANYENAISSNFDQGRALAASAGTTYSNRAAQSGASRLGAGYATGQAMLPFFQQANQMRADLGAKQLQARTAQAGMMTDLASRIGQLQSARQGQMGDLYTGFQNRQQNQNQFNSDLDYRNRSLAQNQSQFDSSQAQQRSEFDVTAGQNASQNRLNALQLAMRMPQGGHLWRTDMFGRPIGELGQQQANSWQQEQSYMGNIRNQLQSYF